MREILFRGKRIDNGEWAYGNLNILNGCIYHIVPLQVYIHTSGIPASEFYDVDPSTVGQYIGLTDENGKKIFEGDILEDTYGNETYRDVVVANRWNCSCCDGVYGYAFEHHAAWLDFRDIESCTVVGNIHDNPELLEVEE